MSGEMTDQAESLTDAELLRLARRAEHLSATGARFDGDAFDAKLLSRLLVQHVQARRERDEARADTIAAAGELLVEIPEPGTVVAKLLSANAIMRRQRDEARAAVEGARRAAYLEAAALLRAKSKAMRDGLISLNAPAETRTAVHLIAGSWEEAADWIEQGKHIGAAGRAGGGETT